MFKVAVQLLSWNGEKYLATALHSLARQTFRDFELFILDNASTDGSVGILEAELKQFSSPVHFIKRDQNIGFAGGHNVLFAMHTAPYVFCLNQDVELEADYLDRVMEALERDPSIGSAAGVLYRPDGRIDSAGLKKNWYEKTFDLTAAPTAAVAPVFGVSGALPVYRRQAIVAVSPDAALFDDRYFAYKEDVDLAWRLHNGGWGAVVVSAARAKHMRGFGVEKKWNSQEYFRQKLSLRNHLLTLIKDLPVRSFWRLPIIIGYELGKAVYCTFFVPKALVYLPEFFKLLPETLKIRKVVQERPKPHQKHG